MVSWKKSGAWLNFGELRLGNGRENAKQYLNEHPKTIEESTKKVMEKHIPMMRSTTPVAEEEKPAAVEKAEKNGKPEAPHAGKKAKAAE